MTDPLSQEERKDEKENAWQESLVAVESRISDQPPEVL